MTTADIVSEVTVDELGWVILTFGLTTALAWEILGPLHACSESAYEYKVVRGKRVPRISGAQILVSDPDNERPCRLLISGVAAEACESLSRRLRGVTTVHGDGEGLASVQSGSVDAVAVLGGAEVEWNRLEHLLTAGRPMLLAIDRGITADELNRLSMLATSARVQLTIANLDRYLPSRQLLKQQLDSGKLGALGLVRMHHWQAPQGSPQREGQLPLPLLLNLEHTLWFFGQFPDRVYASDSGSRAGSATRCIQLHLGFAEGGMALIEHTSTNAVPDEYRSLTLIGAKGAAYDDDHHNMQLLYRQGQAIGLRMEQREQQFTAVIQDFVRSFRGTPDSSSSVSYWRHVWNVGRAAEQSLASGQSVTITMEDQQNG